MVQEGEGVVAQEGDHEIVIQRDEVEGVGEEDGYPGHVSSDIFLQYYGKVVLPMIRPHERHTQELHHIQKHPHRHERAYRHVPAVPKLELFFSGAPVDFAEVVEASPAAGEEGVAWT